MSSPPFHDCGDEAAAYALDALSPSEAESFRRHLEGCVVCQEEVAAFRGLGSALAMSVTQHPAPRRLRRRLIRAVAAEPKAGAQSGLHPARRRPARWLSQRWRPVTGLALGLVAIVLAVVALTAPGATGPRVFRADVVGVPGSAILRVSHDHAELVVRRLPPPAAGDIYQVWLKRPQGPPQSTGALFSVAADGAGDVGIPGNVRGVSQVMVTQEPQGGSRSPTHPPVIVARLA